mgnify:CR=1 FL=1
MTKRTLPTILVSNDDGFSAEGIQALATGLSQFANVVVVAPALNQSAVSQAITLKKPLGIQFEEDGPIVGKSGVVAIGVVDGGSAKKDGTVKPGDKLVGVTAVKYIGSKWERQMFDTRKWDFDTVVDAIGSNDEKFDIYDVVLQFEPKKEE